MAPSLIAEAQQHALLIPPTLVSLISACIHGLFTIKLWHYRELPHSELMFLDKPIPELLTQGSHYETFPDWPQHLCWYLCSCCRLSSGLQRSPCSSF